MPKTDPRPASDLRGGVLTVVPGVVHLALDVADRGQTTAIAFLQESRAELTALVLGGLELAELASLAVFRVLKKTTHRVDDNAAQTLTGVERLVTGAVKKAREPKVATELSTAHAA